MRAKGEVVWGQASRGCQQSAVRGQTLKLLLESHFVIVSTTWSTSSSVMPENHNQIRPAYRKAKTMTYTRTHQSKGIALDVELRSHASEVPVQEMMRKAEMTPLYASMESSGRKRTSDKFQRPL